MGLLNHSTRHNRSEYRSAGLAALLLAFAVFAAACAGTSTTQSPGAYVDDSVITTKVKAAFVADSKLSAYSTGVETYNGVVQLSGFVNSQEDIDLSTKVAAAVPGVKAVHNNLLVKPRS